MPEFGRKWTASTLSGVGGALERNELLSVGAVRGFQLLREQARRLGRTRFTAPATCRCGRFRPTRHPGCAYRLRSPEDHFARPPDLVFANADGSSCKGQMECSDSPGGGGMAVSHADPTRCRTGIERGARPPARNLGSPWRPPIEELAGAAIALRSRRLFGHIVTIDSRSRPFRGSRTGPGGMAIDRLFG